MKCYLVEPNPGQYQLVMVKPEQEAAFMKEYAGKILASGDSIQEVVVKFSVLKKNG